MLEGIIFLVVAGFGLIMVLGLITMAYEKITGKTVGEAPPRQDPQPSPEAAAATQAALLAMSSAVYSKSGFETQLAEYTAEQRADAPFYYWTWVLAADRAGGKREEVLLAVADALLPRGGDRELVGLAEYFWEVEYSGEWLVEDFIDTHLVARSGEHDEAMKARMVEGALMIALMHDPNGNKYLVDESAYENGRGRMLARVRGLCLDWHGSKGEALYAEKLAAAREKVGPVVAQFGYSVAA
jgi:hypothetical protein